MFCENNILQGYSYHNCSAPPSRAPLNAPGGHAYPQHRHTKRPGHYSTLLHHRRGLVQLLDFIPDCVRLLQWLPVAPPEHWVPLPQEGSCHTMAALLGPFVGLSRSLLPPSAARWNEPLPAAGRNRRKDGHVQGLRGHVQCRRASGSITARGPGTGAGTASALRVMTAAGAWERTVCVPTAAACGAWHASAPTQHDARA